MNDIIVRVVVVVSVVASIICIKYGVYNAIENDWNVGGGREIEKRIETKKKADDGRQNRSLGEDLDANK